MRAVSAWLAALAAAVSVHAAQAPAADGDLAAMLEQVGARVEAFYARTRTITSTESVRRQLLKTDLSPIGFARHLVYERRVAWDPSANGGAPEATVLRRLLTVNGRAPRPKDEPECTDPKDVSTDALSMLLPQQQAGYEFKPAGRARVDGRETVAIDFRSTSKETPAVEWRDKGTCVSVSVPDRLRGRLWIDAATYDVLRLDQHLARMFEFPASREAARSSGALTWVLERFDWSGRYREVTFKDPEETLTLPRTIESTTVWRNAGVGSVRVTQEFSDYRRFLTEGRILAAGEVQE